MTVESFSKKEKDISLQDLEERYPETAEKIKQANFEEPEDPEEPDDPEEDSVIMKALKASARMSRDITLAIFVMWLVYYIPALMPS